MAKQDGIFKLRRPCAKCPFRTDVPGYLHRARCNEIARSLADGAIFSCHETTVIGEDEDGDETLVAGDGSQFCAGAILVMEKMEQPNQAVRMAENLGLYDPAKMDHAAPVFGSLVAFAHHHGEAMDAPEQECCHVCGPDCEAPAGFLIGGIAVAADPEGETHECPSCGEHVCDSCSNDGGVCEYCDED